MFCFLDPTRESDCVFARACTKDEVLNLKILSEGRDFYLINCHEHSLHSYFEGQYDGVQEEFFPEQPSKDKQVTECSRSCHVFNDLVA